VGHTVGDEVIFRKSFLPPRVFQGIGALSTDEGGVKDCDRYVTDRDKLSLVEAYAAPGYFSIQIPIILIGRKIRVFRNVGMIIAVITSEYFETVNLPISERE
jgi:hypothetical protein